MAERAVKMRRWQQNHHQQQPTSAVSIPDDVFFIHILPLLPLFSLVRLQCVCKSWHTFLKQFLKDHHRRHCQIMGLIDRSPQFQSAMFHDDDNTISVTQTHTPHPKANIVASCNGYILLKTDDHKDSTHQYILWNPTTSASVLIPRSRKDILNSNNYLDYMRSGLGYDPISKDYKLVLIQTGGVTYTQIYSQKTSCWKIMFRDIPYPSFKASKSSGVYACGCLHWSIYSFDLYTYKYKNSELEAPVIVSFDVAKETFKAVALPDYPKYHAVETSCLDEMLCVLGLSVREWDLCVMKEYGVKESWTKLMTLSFQEGTHMIKPLCLTYTGKVLVCNGRNIVSYDLKAKSKSKSRNTLFRTGVQVEKRLPKSRERNLFDIMGDWTVFKEMT